jgi:effector-binding domain-containing protein
MNATLKLVPATSVIARRDRLTIPQIPAHSGPAIQSLIEALQALNASPSGDGACIYVYHDFDGDLQIPFDLEICLPVDPALRAAVPPPTRLATLPPFRCLAADYVGGMPGIGAAWTQFVDRATAGGHKLTRVSREVYKKWVGFDSPENVTELQQGIE